MVKKSTAIKRPVKSKAKVNDKANDKADDNSDSDDDFGKDKEIKEIKEVVDQGEFNDQVIGEEDEEDKLGDADVDGEEDWEQGDDDEDQQSEQSADASNDVVEIEADGDDDCAYNTGKKRGSKGMNIDRDDEDEDDKYDDDMNMTDGDLTADVYVPNDKRRSSKYLLKYEMVRIKGDRTAQITLGAKPMIKGVEGLSPVDIAQLELEAKMIPLLIIRPLPNGKKEKWSLKELDLKKEYIKFGFTGGEITNEDKEVVSKSGQSRGILGKREMFSRPTPNAANLSTDIVTSTTLGTPTEFESSVSEKIVKSSKSGKSKGKK